MDLSSRRTFIRTSCTDTGTTTTLESQELIRDWTMKYSLAIMIDKIDLSQSHRNQILCFTSHHHLRGLRTDTTELASRWKEEKEIPSRHLVIVVSQISLNTY